MDENNLHRNKTNYGEGGDNDQQEVAMRKSNRFRSLVRKHRRSIMEEAERTRGQPPPWSPAALEKANLIPNVDRLPNPKEHSDLEEWRRKSLWGKIRFIWKSIYHRLGLRHWAFVAMIAAYALLGGLIFSKLERKHFEDQGRATMGTLALERNDLIQQILNITRRGRGGSGTTSADLDDLLKDYQREKSLFPRTDINWDLWDGVFYSYTLFTTIGYGHYVPTSYSGRIATMVYALFGIPLLLAVLADFGKLLTRILKNLYTPARHAIVHLWELRRYKQMKARGEDACISHGETQQDEGQFDFPIPLALLMVTGWLFACAAFFQLWEKTWSYFDAFYFFFISLMTIGLGDLTPNHPKYMIASFPLILIGLTLVSLVVNLIQNKIDELRVRAQELLEDQFGLDTISASECEREAEEGGGAAAGGGRIDAEAQVPTPIKQKDKLGNVALGVMQTINLKAKRRRIGTQTEESYVRDVLRGEYEFERDRPSSARVVALRRGPKANSMASMSSGSYFDAISVQERF